MISVWTDNPVRDADRYQSDQEDNLRCIDCVACGTHLYEGDDYYEIDDMVFCEDCMEDAYKKEVRFDEF